MVVIIDNVEEETIEMIDDGYGMEINIPTIII